MSGARTIETTAQREDTPAGGTPALDHGFGAEFRELARQRRFVRETANDAMGSAAAPQTDWRTAAAPPRPEVPSTTPRTPDASPAATPTPPPAAAAPAQPQTQRGVAAASETALPPLAPAALRSARASQRISDDQRAMLAELARMSDRLVESREALAREIARADRAEHDLQAMNLRFMAARALVLEAQDATHASAERCAWLEGRCETLEAALDVAVNASWLTRLRWRRQAQSAARQQ